MDKKTKVLVFGHKGYLARHFADHYRGLGLSVAAPKTDIRDWDALRTVMREVGPDVVINAAAKTHGWGTPNTAGCESSLEARQITAQVNTLGAQKVAYICADYNIFLIHVSTGSIFSGDNGGQGFSESDLPAPTNYYGRTKVKGDDLVDELDVGVILRLQMPLCSHSHPRNLITKLVGASRVYDIRNSVTAVPSLMMAVDAMIKERPRGIFNVVNPKPISHPEILGWYQRLVDPGHDYHVVSTIESENAGYRGCVLSTRKLEAFGVRLPDTVPALRSCLESYPSP